MTTEPSRRALRSPSNSSRVNSTAAMGVLKAAASAAAAPMGTSACHLALPVQPYVARNDATPAPICTDGPSRPSAMPPPRDSEQQKNLPIDGLQADVSAAGDERSLGLRNTAAARVGKHSQQQIPGDERGDGGC